MKKRLSNADVARVLYLISEMLDLLGKDTFKIRAYQRAARSIELMPIEISRVYKEGGLKGLEGISGVGESIAEKIEELLKTGKLGYYEDLKKKVPVQADLLMKIPGIGPKKIKKLNKALGIKTIGDLRKAAKAHKIAKVPGFGEESEKDILEGLGLMKKARGRIPWKGAKKISDPIVRSLKGMKEVKQIEVVGSFRRKRPTIRDIDIIVLSKKPKPIIDKFTKLKSVKKVFAKGSDKGSIALESGVNADLRVFPRESYGAGLLYFTGSKQYNIDLRKVAMKKGWKLNEYGLFDKKTGKMIAGKSEREICKKLGVKFRKPEDREI